MYLHESVSFIMVEHGWTVINTRVRKCEPRPSPGVSPHPLKVPTFGWVWQCGWRCMPTFAPTRQQLTCSRALWGEWTKGQNNSYSIGWSSRLGQSIVVVASIHQSINLSIYLFFAILWINTSCDLDFNTIFVDHFRAWNFSGFRSLRIGCHWA